MDYQMPVLESLVSLAHGELRALYQGNNNQRLSFISFYENLTRSLLKGRVLARISQVECEEIQKLLTAALIFEYAWIWIKEYSGNSPEQIDSFTNTITKSVCNFFSKQPRDKLGSQLFTILKSKLSDSPDNLIHYRTCLTYVNYLYDYVYHHSYQQDLVTKNNSIWPKKGILLNELLTLLKKIKKMEWDRLAPELTGLPTPRALENNVQERSNHYRQIVDSRSYFRQWLTKRSHLEASHFVDFVNETCAEFSSYQDEDSLKRIRAGAILYVLLIIYNEYSVLSPQYGSDLFAQYLYALNAKGLWKMDVEMQADNLNALLGYITDIRHNKNYPALVEIWKEKGLDLDNYFKHVIKTVPEQQVQLRSSWWYETLFNYSVQYGIGGAAVRYGLPALGRLAIGSMSGPVGIIFYIAGSTIFLTQWGVMVSNNVIPRAVLYLYSCALEKLGNTATDTASSVAKSANKKWRSFFGYEQLSQEDKDELVDFIQDTLLKLPKDVLSEKEKEQIRIVFGFKSEQEIEPPTPVELELDEFVEIRSGRAKRF